MQTDVTIVGAGPAGLLCAVLLARAGRSVLLLEKEATVGRKLCVTGSGRCNIASPLADSRTLAAAYSSFTGSAKPGAGRKAGERPLVKALGALFAAVPPEESRAVLADLGIAMELEDGKWFPAGLDARGVRDRLLSLALEAGARVETNQRVKTVQPVVDGWQLEVRGRETLVVNSRLVVLACGGMSMPAVGGSQDGLALLKNLGVSVQEAHQAMSPLYLGKAALPELSGIVVPGELSVWLNGERGPVCQRRSVGDILFTHKGLSGLPALEVSGFVHANLAQFHAIRANFLPEQTNESILDNLLAGQLSHPHREAWGLLPESLPRIFRETVCRRAGLPADTKANRVSKLQWLKVVGELTGMEFRQFTATPWNEAMSWTGGVLPSELAWPSLELRQAGGVFVIGDLISLDRLCGGYSLDFCWASAIAVARAITAMAIASSAQN